MFLPQKDGHWQVADHTAEDDVVGEGTPPVALGSVARLVAGEVATILNAAGELKKGINELKAVS